jgi:hypothetical protein
LTRSAAGVYGRSVGAHSGEVGGDGVGGVPVEVGAGHVVAQGGAAVGVPHGVLHVPQRDAADESGGAERPAQGVRAQVLGQAGVACKAAELPGCALPGQPVAVLVEQQRPGCPVSGGVPDGPQHGDGQRDEGGLGALAHDREQLVAGLAAQVGDVDPDRLADPQADQPEQRHQRMCAGAHPAGVGQQGVLQRVQHAAALPFPRHPRPGPPPSPGPFCSARRSRPSGRSPRRL